MIHNKRRARCSGISWNSYVLYQSAMHLRWKIWPHFNAMISCSSSSCDLKQVSKQIGHFTRIFSYKFNFHSSNNNKKKYTFSTDSRSHLTRVEMRMRVWGNKEYLKIHSHKCKFEFVCRISSVSIRLRTLRRELAWVWSWNIEISIYLSSEMPITGNGEKSREYFLIIFVHFRIIFSSITSYELSVCDCEISLYLLCVDSQTVNEKFFFL